jgi:glycosyltransferase involved in cell wall biosynthesis
LSLALEFAKGTFNPTSRVFWDAAHSFGYSRALRALLVPDYCHAVLTDDLWERISGSDPSPFASDPAAGSGLVARSALSQLSIAAISRGSADATSIPSEFGKPAHSALKNLPLLNAVRIASALGDDGELAKLLPFSSSKSWWYRDLELARILNGGVLGDPWTATFQARYESAGLTPPKVSQKTTSIGGEKYLGLECPVNDSKRDVGRISVIITTHNPGPWLEESIQSIENQTVAIHEILLVDDHSDARYAEYIDGLSAKNLNLRVIRLTSNRGTYRARFEGIRCASGDYLALQDSDDWSHPERLEKQIEGMKHGGQHASIPVCGRFEESMKAALWRQISPGVENGPGLVAKRAAFTPPILKLFGDGRTGVDGRLLFELGRQKPGTLKLKLGPRGESAPLLIQQARRDSLSGSDYLLGWENPTRKRYKDAYRAGITENPDGRAKLVLDSKAITFIVGGFSKREQERSAKLALSFLSSLDTPLLPVKVYWTNPVRTKKSRIGTWTSRLRTAKDVVEAKSLRDSSTVFFFGVGAALLSRREDFGLLDESSLKAVVSKSRATRRARRNTRNLVYRKFSHSLEFCTVGEAKFRISIDSSASLQDGHVSLRDSILQSSAKV